jgi:hypothetical protein
MEKKGYFSQEDIYADTMEEEREERYREFLNEEEGVFSWKQRGLNTTRSIFDESAVFHTQMSRKE